MAALDLNDRHPFDPNRVDTMPNNIEAEQALLGAILFDNAAFDTLDVEVDPKHFYEPFHQRLWKSMKLARQLDLLVEPIAICEEFARDKAFQELGGLRYLADLVDRAPPAVHANDYAKVVFELATLRKLIRIGHEVVALAKGTLVDNEDGARMSAADIVEHAERDLLQVQVSAKSTGGDLVDIAAAARGVIAYVQDRSKPVGGRSGLPPLDLQLGPLMAGDLILLAGRPSMGKSAVAVSAALNVAAPWIADRLNEREYDGRRSRGVLEIHAEMSINETDGGQVARRTLADIGFGLYGRDFPTYKAMRDKNVSVDQLRMIESAAAELAGVPIIGLKRTGLRLSSLRSIARRQMAAWTRAGVEPGLLVIDHVGLLRTDQPGKRYEQQTEIAIGMKELADELGIPILALVQLSRDIERRDDKRPQLSDLRDSGAWEENADIAAFVYRDAYYAQREKEPDAAKIIDWGEWDGRRKSKAIEIIMGKVREGDAGGSAVLWGELGWNAIRGKEPDVIGRAML